MLRALSYPLLPLIKVYNRYRLFKGKEDPARTQERFAYPSQKRPAGEVVWFHAASVGETLSLVPLIPQYKKLFPNHTILLTTTTRTSGQIVEQFLAKEVIHQYSPYDLWPVLEKFVDFWRPLACLHIESELWPCRLALLKKRGIPFLMINARLSDRSYERWKRYPFLARQVFPLIQKVWAPSQEIAAYFRDLGTPEVETMTHLKWYADPLPYDAQEQGITQQALGNRPFWIAASTHAGEEEPLLEIHRSLQGKFPDLFLFLIPRHPVRSCKVLDLVETKGFKGQLYSRTSSYDSSDTVVVDCLGKMGLFYSLKGPVFLGGSLVPVGGHNPIEPLLHGCPVTSGPFIHKSREIWQAMEQKPCSSVQEVQEFIDSNLRDATICSMKIPPRNWGFLEDLKSKLIR